MTCAAAAAALAVGCDTPQEAPAEAAGVRFSLNGVAAQATGGGEYLLAGEFPMQFALGAVQHANGLAAGQFHQKGDVGGTWVDVTGSVTCLAVDPATNRAWIGGVVSANRSDPDLQEDIHQPGRDVWFRVVDYGQGDAAAADRTTFLGFEGAAGFVTSEDYCAGRPWPDDDARTHPLTGGNLQVK